MRSTITRSLTGHVVNGPRTVAPQSYSRIKLRMADSLLVETPALFMVNRESCAGKDVGIVGTLSGNVVFYRPMISLRAPLGVERSARVREGGMNQLNFQPVGVLVDGLASERLARTREVLLDPSSRLGWLPSRFGYRLLAPLNRGHRHDWFAAGVYPERQAHPAQHLDLLGFDFAASEGDELVLVEEHVRHDGSLGEIKRGCRRHPCGRSMTCRP
jgi:hypothetical protein